MSHQTLSHIYKLPQKFCELNEAISHFVRLSLYVKVDKLLHTLFFVLILTNLMH